MGDGWMNEWLEEWVVGYVDKWTGEWVNESPLYFICSLPARICPLPPTHWLNTWTS